MHASKAPKQLEFGFNMLYLRFAADIKEATRARIAQCAGHFIRIECHPQGARLFVDKKEMEDFTQSIRGACNGILIQVRKTEVMIGERGADDESDHYWDRGSDAAWRTHRFFQRNPFLCPQQ